MADILKFNRSATGYYNIHSFIVECFQVKENKENNFNLKSYPSYYDSQFIYILANKLEYQGPEKALLEAAPIIAGNLKQQQNIKIKCRFTFSNRGKRNNVIRLNPDEAKLKFEKSTGLKVLSQNERPVFLGVQRLKEVPTPSAIVLNIENAFYIDATCKIDDAAILNRAIYSGIGSRKNYGFGLILTINGEDK